MFGRVIQYPPKNVIGVRRKNNNTRMKGKGKTERSRGIWRLFNLTSSGRTASRDQTFRRLTLANEHG